MRAQNCVLQDHHGRHHKWICVEEGDTLVNRKAAKLIGRRKAKGAIFRLIWEAKASDSQDDACCITPSDMQANVGITGGLGDPARGAVMAARIKIKAWPLVYDTKAPMVSPRMA